MGMLPTLNSLWLSTEVARSEGCPYTESGQMCRFLSIRDKIELIDIGKLQIGLMIPCSEPLPQHDINRNYGQFLQIV